MHRVGVGKLEFVSKSIPFVALNNIVLAVLQVPTPHREVNDEFFGYLRICVRAGGPCPRIFKHFKITAKGG